jgi:putative transposase
VDWLARSSCVRPSRPVVRWQRERFRRFWARRSRVNQRHCDRRRDSTPDREDGCRQPSLARTQDSRRVDKARHRDFRTYLSPESSEACRGRPARPGRRSCAITSVRWFQLNFFTVPTITSKVLFVFIVLEHRRREVLHFNVTDHRTAAQTSRQIVEAFAEHDTSRYLLRDRDGVYGSAVRSRIASRQVEEILRAPRSPWQNPCPFPRQVSGAGRIVQISQLGGATPPL